MPVEFCAAGADGAGVERRECYRVDAAETDNYLRLWLHADGVGRIEAEIVDLSHKGVGLRLAPDLAPSLGERQEVQLQFHDLEGEPIPVISARLRSVVRTQGGVRYGLDFRPTQNLAEDLPGHLLVLFNRRAARRIAPPEPVAVEVEPAGDGARMGRLRDISWSGAGVDLPARASPERLGRVTLRFRLPGIEPSFALVGHIQHDLLVDDVVRIGVHFDARASERFPVQQAALKRYVATCYLERKPV